MKNNKRIESFKKIENETFYTSPPYNYRPSIAEYLTTFNVTKNSFVADILHLDYKGNIKIIEFNKEFIKIKLIDNNELDADELFVWDYLKSLENNKEIIFNINKIPKKIIKRFCIEVVYKTTEKFGSNYVKKFNQKPDFNRNYLGIVGNRILLGVIFTIFNIGGILSLLCLILGIKKMSNEKQEMKFFFKKFIYKYIKISVIYFLIFLIPLFFIIKIGNDIDSSSFEQFLIFIPLFVVVFILVWIYVFYQFSKILYDYIYWLMESKEAGENRRQWLSFKSFVINHSELEKTPLAHYNLWGPFYYYTLAVGGIKNLKIR